MPFSHHSHSGQFCSHAKGTLEEMIEAAIAKGFHTFALTEHMPRDDEDMYPEESKQSLTKLFDNYYNEAIRLREAYAPKINILIGMETEWIRPSSLHLIQTALDKYPVELFIGSIHHMHTIPIDYDKPMYERARNESAGTDERLFEDYFDEQLRMLEALKPPIVGHFDLIRLLSDEPDRDLRCWSNVWSKIERNLGFIAGYGGLLELNTAGLRKGMQTPYPSAEICEVFLGLGGRFTLCDDSHAVDHVGTNYHRIPAFLDRVGITQIHYLARGTATTDARFPNISVASIDSEQLAVHGSMLPPS
ncbi:histidinol-phosphatase [Saccharata proteae CBS 121410]|uniref:Histidinol-phosphatase n=1 Tax=Saccharata proteae CBS 121410 TaxID=1314787 RepID=A0A9P4M3V5_9PEZI|nr:histidinol-phosphatase [Saccharata proteae CBS 121410]